jgi:protein TonB
MAPVAAPNFPPIAKDRFSKRAARRCTGALAVSLAIHAAVGAAIWRWTPDENIQLLTPQAGRASIALTASIAAQAEPSPPTFETAPLERDAPPQPEEPTEAPAQTLAALARVDATEPEASPRLFEPVEPVMVVTDDALTPVIVGGQAERRAVSRETPPPIIQAASAPSPARRQFDPTEALPSATSVPSPASQASEGVETDAPPQVVVNRPPVYPAEALAAGQTGRVVIRAAVNAAGRVQEARVHRSSGVAALDRSALEAVRGWRFTAAAEPAAPPRPVNVPIDFVIRR